MAGKQRSRAPRPARNAKNVPIDLSFLDHPNLELMNDEDDSDVDENDLESELEAILSGKTPIKPKRAVKKALMPMDIDSMAAACLEDPDEDDDINDSDLTDPDLLRELQGLSCDTPSDENWPLPSNEIQMPVTKEEPKKEDIRSLLEERLDLYRKAFEAAKACNDNSKIRRYSRGIKSLENLLKLAKSGGNVNEEDIPPVVAIPKESKKNDIQPPSVTVPESNIMQDNNPAAFSGESEPQPPVSESDLKVLIRRRDEYRIAALQAKKTGDKTAALNYMKISKGIESVIQSLKNGEAVDLSNLPPSPVVNSVTTSAVSDHLEKESQEVQTSSLEAAALSAAAEPEDPAIFSAPPAPASVLEALQQRLEKYTLTKDAAAAEGNKSKVRRLERIIKSYETAIKDYKAGKPVDFDELPTPPGFAPIPNPNEFKIKETTQGGGGEPKQSPPSEVKPVAPTAKRPAPQVPTKNSESSKPKLQRANTSTAEKQLEFLLERRKLFREAALESKKNGDIQQAKEYLRMSKGFDSMIEATKCGLPINTSAIPTPPQLQTDFVIVDKSECIEPEEGSTAELLETLEKDLTKQIEVCTRNKDHFLRLGDVSSASKFEKLGLESKKDLSVIRHLKKNGGATPLPKFHYETRLFSVVQCHTDLSDSDLEVTVERGINLPEKSDDLDSYVKLELPIPSTDSPQRAKTRTVKGTNNPIFQEEFKFEIHRKSRAQLRQFKRHALKLEVWSKGGFFRSGQLLGTVSVKLVDLETNCAIHDCFDLMDGRKACGGRLEVKVRIREPLLTKQVEEVREKWLVLGS